MIEKQSKVQKKAENILIKQIPNSAIGPLMWPSAILLIYPYPIQLFAYKLCINNLSSRLQMVNVGDFDTIEIKFTV